MAPLSCMAPLARSSLTTKVIKRCPSDEGSLEASETPVAPCRLPVPCGAVEYAGWAEHRDIGGRLRLRLLVMQADGEGQWQGEWEAAGHQRERVSIRFLDGGRIAIQNVEGRHDTELCGRASWRGTLCGEAWQDGARGGAFRLWPMASEGALRQQLRTCYVALRSGPCEEVHVCEAAGDLPEMCPICFEGFAEGDMIIETPCPGARHVFHRRCVQEWLESHDTCPLCRFVVHTDVSRTGGDTDHGIMQQAMVMSRM